MKHKPQSKVIFLDKLIGLYHKALMDASRYFAGGIHFVLPLILLLSMIWGTLQTYPVFWRLRYPLVKEKPYKLNDT